MKTVTPLLSLLAFSLVAVGCSTLDETQLTASKFPAEAHTAKLEFDGQFRVDRVNGRLTHSLQAAEQLRLVPGTHEVEFTLRAHPDEYTSTVAVSVADHQTLQLKSKNDGPNQFVELWDLTSPTGQPVKISTHKLDGRRSTYANIHPRAGGDTNGNRPLQQ
ncbi:MAG: hypothetical protein HOH58_12485 [Opitutaceae bacterium]|jgi:hypothetical protein|nr:hypothetical protein [Opitutaceae bacterium]